MQRKVQITVALLFSLGVTCMARGLGQQVPAAPSAREHLQQDVPQLQTNPSDEALRTKIIQLALTLDPKPARPPETDEIVGGAKYAVAHAASPADFNAAAEAFGKASLFAPWVPDFYFDQGVAYEKAQNLDAAIKSYRWYLMAAPDASDAKAVREKIGALEFQSTQQQQANAAAQAHAAAEEARMEELRRFNGRYVNIQQSGTRLWSRTVDYFVDIQDGTVTMGSTETQATGLAANSDNQVIGQYQKWCTGELQLAGRHFEYVRDQEFTYRGTIGDDGSITVTSYHGGHEGATLVYQRQ